jgi:catecholate siderophore receptor
MSSARIPATLRFVRPRHENVSSGPSRSDRKTATVLTAACLAALPVGPAFGQTTPGGGVTPLPPVNVEANTPKPRPKADAAQQPQPAANTAAPTPEQKAANPYANPAAPYKVESSGSGKITEPLVNTPRTVTAIPKSVLTDTAATTLRDVARQTPGVTLGFGEGGNAFGDRIYIRGFDARNDIYVDGFRDVGNAGRETFAIEQIEVMKGPAATISGRGVAGGAMNIITKQPTDKNFGSVSTMFGTDGTVRTTLDVNQVVAPGLSVRGNLMYHDADVAGRDQVHDERWGGFFAVAIKPSDNVKINIDYYRYRTNGIPDFGVPLNTSTGQPWTESGVARTNWYGNAARDFMRNSQDSVTAKVEVKLSPDVVLTSRTRYGDTIVDYIATSPNGAANGASTVSTGNANRYQDTAMFGNQTDLTFKFQTMGLKHTLVTGVELSREMVWRYSYSGLTSVTQSLTSPNNYPTWSGIIPPRAWQFTAVIDTAAAYALDTIKLNEQWYINGGVRVDNYNRHQDAATAANTASRTDTVFNWNAGIVYKPVPIASIYAAYATSSNPVGSELDATGVDYGGLALNTAALAPEKNHGMELGTKWELFQKKMLATAALFRTEKYNARESGLNGGNPTSTGAYRVQGIELSAQGNITDKWSVFGGVVLMQSEVLESSTASFVGRQLANVPLTQFSLLSKYKITDAFTLGGQATYSGKVYAGVLAAADSGYHIPDHWRFDVLSEYKFNQNFSMQLNVVNLTNELYYDALYRSNAPFVFVAPGRAGYLTLTYKY